ncbi:MAG: alpha/beta fold hydrolase [Pseudomonadota bacterium]
MTANPLTPFFFGDSAEPLYGVFYPAAESEGRNRPAILLCPPFGEEAVRAFRILRLLAQRLSAAGHPVLRFDYRGTGDSAGACESVTLARWAEDVATTHQEVMDMSGTRRVVWVGVRLGATAALQAAQTLRPRGLSGLLLWSPIADGPGYLETLAARHRRELSTVFDQPHAQIARRVTQTGDTLEQVTGYAVPDPLRREISALSAETLGKRTATRSLALVHAPDDTETAALSTSLAHAGVKSTLCEASDAAAWNSDQAMNAFVIPQHTVRTLQTTIEAWR